MALMDIMAPSQELSRRRRARIASLDLLVLPQVKMEKRRGAGVRTLSFVACLLAATCASHPQTHSPMCNLSSKRGAAVGTRQDLRANLRRGVIFGFTLEQIKFV